MSTIEPIAFVFIVALGALLFAGVIGGTTIWATAIGLVLIGLARAWVRRASR